MSYLPFIVFKKHVWHPHHLALNHSGPKLPCQQCEHQCSERPVQTDSFTANWAHSLTAATVGSRYELRQFGHVAPLKDGSCQEMRLNSDNTQKRTTEYVLKHTFLCCIFSVIVILFVMRKRYQKDSLANMKNSGEIHEQLVTYDEEGGGEMDTNGYVDAEKKNVQSFLFNYLRI